MKGYSNSVKSNIEESSQKTKTLVHISGSMSTNLCSGEFSNFENTFSVKVFGLDLKFSGEYLSILRKMTGTDVRQMAYKMQMVVKNKGKILHCFRKLQLSLWNNTTKLYIFSSCIYFFFYWRLSLNMRFNSHNLKQIDRNLP